MQQHLRTQLKRVARVTALVGVALCVAQPTVAEMVYDARHADTIVTTRLSASDVRTGTTIKTPGTRFHLRVPAETVRKATAGVTIKRTRRKRLRKGKWKVKTKNVFTYSISSKLDGPVTVRMRNNRLKRTDTLKYFHKRSGTWKKIPSRVQPGKNRIQGQLKRKNATIALFQKKKRRPKPTVQKGQASWYVVGDGELTAAHKTLPMGTVVRVKNTGNGRTVDVTIADRGPFIQGRIVDLSKRAFRVLDAPSVGVLNVHVTVVSRP
jgi:hypothetical protein